MNRNYYPSLFSASESTHGMIRPVLGSPVQEGCEKQERSIQRADEMLSGLQHLTCENMLKKLGLVSLSKKKIRGDLIRIYNYLKGSGKDH